MYNNYIIIFTIYFLFLMIRLTLLFYPNNYTVFVSEIHLMEGLLKGSVNSID